MYKNIIRIGFVEYTVTFWLPRKYSNKAAIPTWDKWGKELKGLDGVVFHDIKEIHILIPIWNSDKVKKLSYTKIIWDSLREYLWHEVGHIISRELPSSLMNNEWMAVGGEWFAKVMPELQRVERQLKEVVEGKEWVVGEWFFKDLEPIKGGITIDAACLKGDK